MGAIQASDGLSSAVSSLHTSQNNNNKCTVVRVAGCALMAIAALCGVGCLVLTFTVGIIPAVASVVSGVALAFLGDYLIKKDSEDEPIFHQAIAQRVWHCRNQPIGLVNLSNVCWANAYFQAVLLLPEIRDIIVNQTPEQFGLIRDMILQYEEDQRSQRSVSQINTQELRIYMPQFRVNGFEDATELNQLLTQFRFEGRSPIHVQMKSSRFYSLDNAPEPSDSSIQVEYDPMSGQMVGCSQRDVVSFGEVSIPLHLDAPFDELLRSYFSSYVGPNTEEFGNYYTIDGHRFSYPLHSTREVFEQAPPYLFLNFKRYDHSKPILDMQGRLIGYPQIPTQIPVPLEFSLPPSACEDGRKVEYKIRSIIEHIPSGHYKAYKRVDEGGETYWFCMNDASIVRVPEESALASASRAYMIVAEKIE